MTIVIGAVSFKGIGYSQAQTAEQLVSQHAYGPGGQVYRGSADAESAIRRWVAEVYSNGTKYRPDTDFHQFYAECLRGSQ
jgi:hypothetical protein